jgi:hypothetical protein
LPSGVLYDAFEPRIWHCLQFHQFLTPSSDLVTFATGGYARGLQTKAMMHKIDADGEGTVSHDEFIAYQTKVFEMMDAGKSGVVGPQAFLGK